MRAVVFAGRDHESSRIAKRIAVDISRRGVDVDARDVATTSDLEWSRYDAVCLVASGSREDAPAIAAFVRRHRRSLEQSFAACLWVDRYSDRTENSAQSATRDTSSGDLVRTTPAALVQATGWTPSWLLRVAHADGDHTASERLTSSSALRMSDDDLDWARIDRFANDIVIEAEHRLARKRRKAA